MREELTTVQRDLEASRVIRGELALELANATTDRKLAQERLESEQLRADGLIKQIEEKEQAIAKLENQLSGTVAELKDRDIAIATLTTENQKLEASLAEATKNEIFLSKELQQFKYGVSVALDEPLGEQLQLFPPEPVNTEEEQATVKPEPETIPTPEPESENTESPAVNPQPSTVNPQPEETEPDTTEVLQTEVQPKLLNPKQLAEWINKNCNPEKPITDQNVRDWYNPKKTCEEKRLENEQKYGHKLDHKDKKGTLWFTVG